MDDLKLPTPLLLLWDVKRALESHRTSLAGVESYTKRNLKDDFSQKVIFWLNNRSSQQKPDFKSLYQRQLIGLIQKSYEGISIYEQLKDLEKEMVQVCEDDIERHLQKLPLLLQIPLMGLIFPAIMMILIVPILNMLSF